MNGESSFLSVVLWHFLAVLYSFYDALNEEANLQSADSDDTSPQVEQILEQPIDMQYIDASES